MLKKYTLLFLFSCGITIMIAQRQHHLIPNEYLIQLTQETTIRDLKEMFHQKLPNVQLEVKLISGNQNIFWLKTKDIADKKIINTLSPILLQLHNDFRLEPRNEPIIPNDSDFDQQWNMNIINAPKAWTTTTGGLTRRGDTIVVAIIDSGFDLNHEDLKPNIWHNYHEIPNDSIDNDNNGYTDDFDGWVVRDGNDNHPVMLHGTAVSGIIGAVGNNDLGVSGINWNTKILPISGVLQVSDVIAAYDYILKMRQLYNATDGAEGAYIVATNLSLGIPRAKAENFPMWCDMYNQLGQVGILSMASTANDPVDVDDVGDMPTTCTSDYLISVTNTDRGDSLTANAAFGAVSIDLGAPGSGTYTTFPANSYSTFGGTSGASPHVAGAAALLYSLPYDGWNNLLEENPKDAALLVKEKILEGVNLKSSLEAKTVSEGRLNIANSIVLLEESFNEEPPTSILSQIYPNPVLNTPLQVQLFTTQQATTSFYITNAMGQIMQETTIEVNSLGTSVHPLNVQKLQGGVYFLTVIRDDFMETIRFMKY